MKKRTRISFRTTILRTSKISTRSFCWFWFMNSFFMKERTWGSFGTITSQKESTWLFWFFGWLFWWFLMNKRTQTTFWTMSLKKESTSRSWCRDRRSRTYLLWWWCDIFWMVKWTIGTISTGSTRPKFADLVWLFRSYLRDILFDFWLRGRLNPGW